MYVVIVQSVLHEQKTTLRNQLALNKVSKQTNSDGL